MLLTERYVCCEIPSPRSFAALMEMYEANYIRLRRLCPGLSSLGGQVVSRVHGALDLHLIVLERSRYTTTLALTYELMGECGELTADPNLVVRMYHDARQAEVLSRSSRREGGEISIEALRGHSALSAKWRLNRFLFKWLGYCLHQGHRFEMVEPEGEPALA